MHTRASVASVVALVVAFTVGAHPAETTPEAPSPPSSEELAKRVDAFVAPLLAEDQLPGRLVVRLGSGAAITRDWGRADRELAVPVDPGIVFNVASVTKTMTSIALLGLVADEKLAMDDAIDAWLPDFPRAGDITVEMLARHRAGVPHRVTEPCDESTPRTAADMVRLAAARGLDFEPGSEESYSSAGYSVLVRVMELASGLSYAELLDMYVFAPAGMDRSAHADARTLLEGRASSYALSGSGVVVNAPLKDLSFLVGAGSVWSTADDLVRMARTLRDGGYGPAAADELIGDRGFRSNGLTSGFRAFVDWHRDTDVTVAFTGNLVTGAADLVRRAVPRLAAGEEVTPPSVPGMTAVAVDAATLETYEGAYSLRPGRDLRVHAEDGGLRIGEWILVPVGEHTFVSPQDYATVRVVLGDDGRPERLDWTSGGTISELPWSGPLEETTQP